MLLLLLACTAPVDTADTDPIDLRDPSRWDCRAAEIPARTNPIDPACMLDRGCPELLVTGHRGMGGPLGKVAPENTLSAVRAAIAFGVDYVETDPRPTADGVLVNLHDGTVDRTTDGEGEASAMTLAEVQALAVDASLTPNGDFACERIPTLVEVLETARGGVHVLVDANKTDRVDLLVEAIVQADALDWAIFDTSSVDKIDAALALEPRLHTMIRVDTSADLYDQLAHFIDHPPIIVEVDQQAREVAADVAAAGHRPFTDVFMLDLGAWDDDDTGVYDEAYAGEVRIVQSDRPELVLQSLGR